MDTTQDVYWFRANVAACIVKDDQVLLFQRRDHPEAWQCPQGGLDVGEDVEVGAWRELQEETGLDAEAVSLKAQYPDWLSYSYPLDGTKKNRFGNCIGQTQKWFCFEFHGDESQIQPDNREFTDWKWVSVSELLDYIPDFKRPVYLQIVQWLQRQ